jgi:hypothetical protein
VSSTERGVEAAPMRFVGFLQPGHKAFVSAGKFETTAEPESLQLVQQGNSLSAIQVTNVAIAK